jgi:hypothetical protein
MTRTVLSEHATMESAGAYNRNSARQAVGAALALPIFEAAARSVVLDEGDAPVIIADYGVSQGRNSLAPMRAACRILRARIGASRPIGVVHSDLPTNDFSTLFHVLETDPDRYIADDPMVFPSAAGRSFYQLVLPPASVHLGWSAFAVHWQSAKPMNDPCHFQPVCANPTVRAAFARQAAADWVQFLHLRARELRSGGRLVVIASATEDDAFTPLSLLFDHANAVLSEMLLDGAISEGERQRMTVSNYLRSRKEILAPFSQGGSFEGLRVIDCTVTRLPDPAWVAFQEHGDPEQLAADQAGFVRAVFSPSLAGALEPFRSRAVFTQEMERRLQIRLSRAPAPYDSLVSIVGVVKAWGSPIAQGSNSTDDNDHGQSIFLGHPTSQETAT